MSIPTTLPDGLHLHARTAEGFADDELTRAVRAIRVLHAAMATPREGVILADPTTLLANVGHVVAVEGGKIVGYLSLHEEVGDVPADYVPAFEAIGVAFVVPSHRRRGIATRMLD